MNFNNLLLRIQYYQLGYFLILISRPLFICSLTNDQALSDVVFISGAISKLP